MPIFRADCRIPNQNVLTLSPIYVQAGSAPVAQDFAQFKADAPKADRRMNRVTQRIDRDEPGAPIVTLSLVDLDDVPDNVEIHRADDAEPRIERKVHLLRLA